MDNNYYTGATLIRGSHHHHVHGHYHPPPSPSAVGGPGGGSATSTSLAGPPLLMQPRNNKNHLFSGAPLIRNGHQSMNNGCGPVVSVQSNAVQSQQQPSPGVICCFQPVYYVPMQQNPSMHLPPQLSLPPPPSINKKLNSSQGQMPPKRRNYKSLQISNKSNNITNGGPPTLSTVTSLAPIKPGGYQTSVQSIPSSPLLSTSSNLLSTPSNLLSTSSNLLSTSSNLLPSSPHHSTSSTLLTTSSPLLSSSSSPLLSTSSPLMKSPGNHSNRPEGLLSPAVDHNNIFSLPSSNNNNCNGCEDNNELNFQSAIESSRYLISNEEKQRSDKLLNFYFYDEHWRPREAQPIPSPSASSSCSSSSSSSSLSAEPISPTLPASRTNVINYGSNDMDRRMSITDNTENNWMDHIQQHNHLNTTSDFENNNKGFSRHVHPRSIHPHRLAPGRDDTRPLRISPGQGLNETDNNNSTTNGLSASAMVIKKKDLEVEAQIVTLANGHRDLEIRLCYVTS